jgi:hypothetical protein
VSLLYSHLCCRDRAGNFLFGQSLLTILGSDLHTLGFSKKGYSMHVWMFPCHLATVGDAKIKKLKERTRQEPKHIGRMEMPPASMYHLLSTHLVSCIAIVKWGW